MEDWARLADALAAKFSCTIALTGDRTEVALAAEIAATMKSPAQVLAGKLSLTDLAKTQARSLAFISGDTGPYHLAVAVGCPTMTLFAPTDPGSSVEACGPHQANPIFHRVLQTAKLGDPITTLSFEQISNEASIVMEASLTSPTHTASA
jgi:ADP-heptose:LPS heptosyltransferase